MERETGGGCGEENERDRERILSELFVQETVKNPNPTIIFGLIMSGCCVVNTAMKATDMCIFLNKNALLPTQKCNTPAMEISLPGYKSRCYVLVTTTPRFLRHCKGVWGSMQGEGDKAAPVPFLDGSARKGQEKKEQSKNHLSLLV